MKSNVVSFIDMLEIKLKNDYYACKNNPDNMSFWLPKISSSTTSYLSILKLPETKIISLDFDTWRWIRTANFTKEKVKEFTQYILDRLGDFLSDQKLFMKTGVFSNKFKFNQNIVLDREEIATQFLEMYYYSMLIGQDLSAEIVLREFLESDETKFEIYHSMPLRTEYRVFYDFTNKKVIGIMNYWHPEIMEREGVLTSLDFQLYQLEKQNLQEEFDKHKEMVIKEVDTFMLGCDRLRGTWSVDVMKNNDDFWIIDMARMEDSELIDFIEKI